jgi:glycosyltransferase involved in cell wall biosynthesis/2-polyprenyl-3-methyl-5-hydroxy-6-metoxy-1,4-benzoquinol methylase
MITRLLNLCGLYLGPDDEMMQASDDNPEGYWENQHFTNFNDEILSLLGGRWDVPPNVEPGWAQGPRFDPLRHRVSGLAAGFDTHAPWGWKDPRNCITLEFWLSAFPDLKLVLCMRNPLEVARSLSTGKPLRNLAYDQALRLWVTYHERILQTIKPDRLIVTHYDTYFYDAQAELQRVTGALGMDVPDSLITQAVEAIKPGVRHHTIPPQLLRERGLPEDAYEHYRAFCLQAGPVYQRMMGDSAYQLQAAEMTLKRLSGELQEQDTLLRQLEEEKARLEADLHYREQEFGRTQEYIASLEAALARKEQEVTAHQDQLNTLRGELASSREQYRSLKRRLQLRDEQLRKAVEYSVALRREYGALSRELDRVSRQLEEVHTSFLFRLLIAPVWRIRRAVIPPDSRREAVYGRIRQKIARLLGLKGRADLPTAMPSPTVTALSVSAPGICLSSIEPQLPPVVIPPGATVVCTIVSKNYLAAARVLTQSIRAWHDELYPVVLLVDRTDGYFDPADEPFQMLLAADLGIPGWEHFSAKYDILELNTAVKPYLIDFLFERFAPQKVIYFDPDIVVHRRLDDLLALLDRHTVVLTPHLLSPLDDEYRPGDLDILRAGAYNLGFIALSRSGRWKDFLQWWQHKVYSGCVVEPENGLFVDQRWIDLAPGLFPGICILNDPGYNVAYWNFKGRDLQAGPEGYTVNGSPLAFFHFSGFMYDNIAAVSKHQNRYRLADLNEQYQALFRDYHRRLREAGYEQTRCWPYAYGFFSDGVPVTPPLRRCLRRYDPQGVRWPNPCDLSGGGFRDWAVHPAAELSSRYISPYALTLHRMRPDLQRAFPDPLGADEKAYARWFVDNEGTSEIFHPVYVEPVRAALEDQPAGGGGDQASPQKGNGDDQGKGSLRLRGRLALSLRYYARYPKDVKPWVPHGSLASPPDFYTGPSGVYGRIRRLLQRLGILRLLRKLVGLRLILTARYFFSYPHVAGIPVPEDLKPPLPSSAPLVAPEPERQPEIPAQPLTDGVNIIGYVYSETGVGQQARNMLLSLRAVGFPAAVYPIEAHDPARKQDRLADSFPHGAPHRINVFHVNADMTFVVRNLLPPALYENRYNIAFWSWELSAFPGRWQDCFGVYDEIWVPSTFIRSALAKWTRKPVTCVPIHIEVPVPEDITRAELGLPEDAFIVLYMFDALSVIERKNPWAAIRAFKEAFSKAERRQQVRLVIKAANLDRFPHEAARLRAEMREVNGILIESYLDRPRVNALLNQCDVYLSLHRAEGYGLTLAEAMALGKPVIATAYSGNMDFMTPANSYLVPCHLVELERDYPPYEKGSVWAEPDAGAAAEILRQVYEHPEEANSIGQNAAKTLKENNNAHFVGNSLDFFLNMASNDKILEEGKFSGETVEASGRGRKITDPETVATMVAQVPVWYHRIELLPNVVTPGVHDSPGALAALDALGLPLDCTGLRVLDVGCRDGFFAFEMEQRGAQVVAMDYVLPTRTGFYVASKILASRVKFVVDNVYELSPIEYGYFDIVLFLGVLYHLRNPLLAIDRIRSVMKPDGLLFVETQLSNDSTSLEGEGLAPNVPPDEIPVMSKWVPNMAGLKLMLEEAQFKVVESAIHGARGLVRAEAVVDPVLEHFRRIDSGKSFSYKRIGRLEQS